MKKHIVYFDSTGPSGNIYHILFLAKNQLRREQRIIDFNNCMERVHNSHSYDEALSIIREYVNLIDIGGKNE